MSPHPLSQNGHQKMTELINDLFYQIEQILLWLKIAVYLIFGLIVIWLVGLIRHSLGIDSNSLELKRIRRLLEREKKEKTAKLIVEDDQ